MDIDLPRIFNFEPKTVKTKSEKVPAWLLRCLLRLLPSLFRLRRRLLPESPTSRTCISSLLVKLATMFFIRKALCDLFKKSDNFLRPPPPAPPH